MWNRITFISYFQIIKKFQKIRATLEGFNNLPRFSKLQVTAAGKIVPAKVFVLGAGVAGLASIGNFNILN
jgi:NAD(P) transhydrogenase